MLCCSRQREARDDHVSKVPYDCGGFDVALKIEFKQVEFEQRHYTYGVRYRGVVCNPE